MGRNSEWLDIWQKKYSKVSEKNLHESDGYDGLTTEQFDRYVDNTLSNVVFSKDDEILEVGCGCGAILKKIKGVQKICGVDYSSEAIEVLKNIMEGEFCTAEASRLPFEDDRFDVVMSIGVFLYFDSLDYARKALDEMRRVLNPGGTLLVTEINDSDKKELAMKLRGRSDLDRKVNYVSDKKLDQFFYNKEFFKEYAEEHNLKIEIYDEDDADLDFYENSKYRFSLVMK